MSIAMIDANTHPFAIVRNFMDVLFFNIRMRAGFVSCNLSCGCPYISQLRTNKRTKVE